MKPVSSDRSLADFDANPPADLPAVARCQFNLNFELPPDYVQFLGRMNGGEGFVGGHYLKIWPVEELIESNVGYGFRESKPEFFLFGSNGAGEGFAFDRRRLPPSIVMIPFIGGPEDAISVASDFQAFLQRLYHSESLFDPIA